MKDDLLRAHVENLRQATGVQFSPMFDAESAQGTNFRHRLNKCRKALRGKPKGNPLWHALDVIEGELVRRNWVAEPERATGAAVKPPYRNRRLAIVHGGGR